MKFKEKKNSILNKLTVILTTHNSRDNFIFRCLDNYNKEFGKYNLQIIVSDSGDQSKFDKLKIDISNKKYDLKIKFINFNSKGNYELIKRDAYGEVKYEYTQRLKDALYLIDTEYVVLAADDDFYFPDYFLSSLNFLEGNKDYGSVYGHMLKFKLDKFIPYGKINNLWISEDNNPPNPWLEDDKFDKRLFNLGKNPWSWFSWYSVQRKYLLQITVDEAIKYNIDGYLFEKFVSFCHAVLYKSKKKDLVYAARQEHHIYFDNGREPFSYKRNIAQYESFIQCCIQFLKKFKKIDYMQSKNIVLSITSKDLSEYKKNDKKEFFRFLKKKISLISTIQKKIFKVKVKSLIDPRLVGPNQLNFPEKQAEYIKNIVERNL